MGKKDNRKESGDRQQSERKGTEGKLERNLYEETLVDLQAELVKLQEWVVARGERVIVVFEGRDAAGKGGVIKRITERVSPRIFRVVALPAPTEREKSQLYGGRRNCAVRPQLVQPGGGGTGDEFLQRNTVSPVSYVVPSI